MLKNTIMTLLLSLLLCFHAGCAVNPISGEQQLMLFSTQQDVELGRNYAPEIEKQMGGRIQNTQLQNYINSVGQKIARVSHPTGFDYQYAALNDKSVNALALPGGYIFITKGMLSQLQSEAQLAGILAHETVHVVARHSSAAMSTQIGIDILLSAATNEKTPQAVSTSANLVNQIVSLRYSRRDESESDIAGMAYMVNAGYNPEGMVETMEILESQSETKPIEFLSSHPSPQSRIEYLSYEMQSRYPSRQGLITGQEHYKLYVLQNLD